MNQLFRYEYGEDEGFGIYREGEWIRADDLLDYLKEESDRIGDDMDANAGDPGMVAYSSGEYNVISRLRAALEDK